MSLTAATWVTFMLSNELPRWTKWIGFGVVVVAGVGSVIGFWGPVVAVVLVIIGVIAAVFLARRENDERERGGYAEVERQETERKEREKKERDAKTDAELDRLSRDN